LNGVTHEYMYIYIYIYIYVIMLIIYRDFLPSLETYFEDAIVELDPAAMIDDKYK